MKATTFLLSTVLVSGCNVPASSEPRRLDGPIEVIKDNDKDGDGKLSFDEFKGSAGRLQKMTKSSKTELIKKVFLSYDINHDGFISLKELENAQNTSKLR